MKKLFSFIVLVTLFSFSMPHHHYLVSGKEQDVKLINSFEKDITGDGFEEYIRLQASLLTDSSTFYQDVWLSIQNAFKKEWSISLQQGYKPETTLIDLTGDKNADIFYQVAKDEHLNHFHYQLYQLNQNKIKAIDMPVHQYINSEFADNFTMEVSTDPTKEPKTIDLSDHKDFYIENKIYHPSGEPVKDSKPTISKDDIIEPFLISNSKGHGLKTTHILYGLNNKDAVGTIETIWYFEKDKWINIKTDVQKR